MMKQDGYMPVVTQEEPIEEYEAYMLLASKLGIEDYHRDLESGIEEDTIVIHGAIPPKYLSV